MVQIPVERSSINRYENLSGKFIEEKNDFTKQYCNIYNVRLRKMRILLQEKSKKKWKVEFPICELHMLPDDNSKCIVIGTLFKDQKLKPSILKQLAEVNSLVPQPVYTHFTDETDTLYMEDELQRIQITGTLNGKKLVTGITCALLGQNCGNGKFQVEDYCFAGIQAQIERPLLNEDLYVVFISGLSLLNIQENLLPLRFFIDWISGLLGDIDDIEVKKIARLIIAGNSSRNAHVKTRQTTSLTSRTVEPPDVLESVKVLDTLLYELSQVLQIDVMPGEHDPSNHTLPQIAMHHCMFPKAMKYKSFNRVPNPYNCKCEGVNILGTSGQPVKNILALSDISTPIEALECCLNWSHIAPTAPDTLACYPFYKNDPFVMDECPHVMFTANESKFDTKLLKDDEHLVRLICIPEFLSTSTAVVLNLKNLDCRVIKFN